jgi:mycofactocin precursor
MENERKEKERSIDDCKEHKDPMILEEITIEELAVDGICGVY